MVVAMLSSSISVILLSDKNPLNSFSFSSNTYTFQQTYNALGCGKNAFFFAFFRKIILLIPLIYLLPFILPSYGVYAVVLAEPISDLMTTILNGIYFKHFVKKTLA